MALDFLETIKKDIKVKDVSAKNNTTNKSEPKQAPSLFDSLLKDVEETIKEPKSDINKDKQTNELKSASTIKSIKKIDQNSKIEANKKQDEPLPKNSIDKLTTIIVKARKELESIQNDSKLSQENIKKSQSFNEKNLENIDDVKQTKIDIKSKENNISRSVNIANKDNKNKIDNIKSEEHIKSSLKNIDNDFSSEKVEKDIKNNNFSNKIIEKDINSKLSNKQQEKIISSKTSETKQDELKHTKTSDIKLEKDINKIENKTTEVEFINSNLEVSSKKTDVKSTIIENTQRKINKSQIESKLDNNTKNVKNIDRKINKDPISNSKTIEVKKVENDKDDLKIQDIKDNENNKKDLKVSVAQNKIVDDESTIQRNSGISSMIDNIMQEVDNNVVSSKSSSNNKVKIDTKSIPNKEQIIGNIFLGSQKTAKDLSSAKQLQDATNIVEKDKSIKSVIKSADMLDLNIDESSIKVTKENEKSGIDIQKVKQYIDIPDEAKEEKKKNDSKKSIDKKTILSSSDILASRKTNSNSSNLKIAMSDTIKDTLSTNNQINDKIAQEKIISTEKIIQENKLSQTNIQNIVDDSEVEIKGKDIQINVPVDAANILKNKIIGAQQKMSSFMSDIAKNMYQNYKPPITAFRLNLNPGTLGSISIVMRSNKSDNTLKVSMNISSNNTREVFIDNKQSLQSALARNLGDNTALTLDFGMDGNSADSGGDSNQNFNNQNSYKPQQLESNIEETIAENSTEQSSEYL